MTRIEGLVLIPRQNTRSGNWFTTSKTGRRIAYVAKRVRKVIFLGSFVSQLLSTPDRIMQLLSILLSLLVHLMVLLFGAKIWASIVAALKGIFAALTLLAAKAYAAYLLAWMCFGLFVGKLVMACLIAYAAYLLFRLMKDILADTVELIIRIGECGELRKIIDAILAGWRVA